MLAVCICTHRRPAALRALLDALPAQHQRPDAVCVIDNDAAGEGLAVVGQLRADAYPLALHAAPLASGGISAARNAVLALALSSGAHHLALIDDDELPDPAWLAQLLRVQRQSGAAAVGGPTRPVFAPGTPAVLRRSPYYGADLGLPDGSACQLQAGGNALLSAALLGRRPRPWFDPRLDHSGGEDLAFFLALARAGEPMHWAAEAVVHEAVPAHRATPRWLRERAGLIANSRVFVTAAERPGVGAAVLRVLKTATLGLQAGAASLLAPFGGAGARLHSALLRAKFRGKWWAHWGHRWHRTEGH